MELCKTQYTLSTLQYNSAYISVTQGYGGDTALNSVCAIYTPRVLREEKFKVWVGDGESEPSASVDSRHIFTHNTIRI